MQTKSKVKTKNKRGAEKAVGAVQTDNPKDAWSHLLYVRKNGADWEQLAYWALMAKSRPGCLPEIRLTRASLTVLQLQYKFGGQRSGLLRENAKRNRPGKNGRASNGQKRNRRRHEPLSFAD